jgi:hypothetical protein
VDVACATACTARVVHRTSRATHPSRLIPYAMAINRSGVPGSGGIMHALLLLLLRTRELDSDALEANHHHLMGSSSVSRETSAGIII